MTFYRYPSDDPGVRPSELEYLTTNIHPKEQLPVPWTEIATSLPVWSVMVANFGSTAFYTVLILYMPVYLKYSMKVDVVHNGFLSMWPPLGQMVFMYMVGMYATVLQDRNRMEVSTIRKVKVECLLYV